MIPSLPRAMRPLHSVCNDNYLVELASIDGNMKEILSTTVWSKSNESSSHLAETDSLQQPP